jgi:hypothetical protein
MKDYEQHSELARAKVRHGISALFEAGKSLQGWMNTAGYDARDMQRVNEAVTQLRALHDTIVLVHLEAEGGEVIAL